MNSLQWVAVYNDGTILRQYEGAEKRAYEDIDRDKLSAFVVYRNGYQKKILELHFEEGQRLIYRKRELNGEGWRYPAEVYLIGWQMTKGEESIQSIHYIFGDDTIISRGSWTTPIPDGVSMLADEEIRRLYHIRRQFGPGMVMSPVELIDIEK